MGFNGQASKCGVNAATHRNIHRATDLFCRSAADRHRHAAPQPDILQRVSYGQGLATGVIAPVATGSICDAAALAGAFCRSSLSAETRAAVIRATAAIVAFKTSQIRVSMAESQWRHWIFSMSAWGEAVQHARPASSHRSVTSGSSAATLPKTFPGHRSTLIRRDLMHPGLTWRRSPPQPPRPSPRRPVNAAAPAPRHRRCSRRRSPQRPG